MATSYYSTGTISLTNGSAVVTGSGTAWQTALIEGGNIFPKAVGMPLPIASVDSNVQITAEFEWVGATGTYEYRIQRDTAYLKTLDRNSENVAYLLDEMRKGTLFKYDASGTLADLSLFSSRPKGFSYLAIGGPTAALYVKQSNADGDWVGPYTYGAGPVGPAPTLTVGTVGTVSPGQQPSAVFVGGNGAYALNLTLPEGELTPADEALLDQKVAAATAEANRAASYVPSGVAKSISGLVIFNGPTNLLTQIGVTAGSARDKNNNIDIVLPVGMSKWVTSWNAGEGGGFLDVGSSAPAFSTWHIFVIRNPTSGAVDILGSTSPTSPVMPAGYTQRRRIGIVQMNANGQVYAGVWRADGSFEFAEPITVSTNKTLEGVSLLTVLNPSGVKRKWNGTALMDNAAAGFWLVARDPDVGVPVSASPGVAFKPSETRFFAFRGDVWCDTAGRVYVASNPPTASNKVIVVTHGWLDLRDEFI